MKAIMILAALTRDSVRIWLLTDRSSGSLSTSHSTLMSPFFCDICANTASLAWWQSSV